MRNTLQHTENGFGNRTSATARPECGMVYHHICDRTSASVNSSDYWKRFYLGIPRPQSIVCFTLLVLTSTKVDIPKST